MTKNILQKIEKAGLVGRGGAEFPTHLKWKFTKKSKAPQKYVVCNASEGETGLFKDHFILKNHLKEMLNGLTLAMDFLKTKEAYINLNKNYYDEIKSNLNRQLSTLKKKGYNISIYKEEPSYIGGEETALLNAIEEKRIQPRYKPPYTSEKGLNQMPTLVHNVETLYDVYLAANDKYDNQRFCCISGQIKNPGVFRVSNYASLEEILHTTKNFPRFDFFAQVGGSISGPVFNKSQLAKEKLTGAGSIEIYKSNVSPAKVLNKWFKFYHEESCGKCTPCREGTYQLY
ncbi:hypothetical protein GF340_04730, partial [Candidatus Peregrinibacteria bacterium]|nr:hypothetical protein [Candidatus Peregrinibacteria bacterium]